jgi:hypothetical protein
VNSDYERVGEAIADVMFGSASAGRPVYAFADTDTLRRVLAAAGVDGEDEFALAAVVRSTLAIEDVGVAPFRWQAEAAERHLAQPAETPPALPLLVLLAIVAEQMHADGDLAAHNYYSRLHRLLTVPTDSYARIENGYRRHADRLWGSLNSWLETWEGERGVPTAYAVDSHAFVGLPMSQAVVRQHDRAGLHELFALEGMTPGLRISPADMSATVDLYASATPSPLSSHLLRLWRVPAARERLIDAACLELESWDGSGQEEIAEARQVASTRLLAFLRTFPRKSIEFNLMLPYRSAGVDVAHFRAASNEISVPTVSGPGGSTRLSGVDGVSAGSLIGEQLEGSFGEDGSRTFGRRPKRVTPLRWDDLQGAYVEIERVALGEESIVLCSDDARYRVETYLAAHARPGWGELAGLPGMPDGWVVIQPVQIISAPVGQTHFDLLPLVPRARTSLTLQGGFVLPGLLRKWSSHEPPEVVALSAGAESVVVRIYEGTRIDVERLVIESDAAGELLVLPLVGRGLGDGEYVVAMFLDGGSRPASTALLRLRSASSPQFRVEDADIRLVYSPDSSSSWPVSAGSAEWARYVNGAKVVALGEVDGNLPLEIREFVPRRRFEAIATKPRVQVGVPMRADSCLVTGMHRFQLPPALPGAPSRRSVEGECTTCGLVRRFAGTPWAARRRERNDTTRTTAFEIPAVAKATDPDLEVAFDSLNHVGHGSFGVFERIAAQIEGSGLFADSFLRRQEVVGHIDVARDDRLQAAEWAVNSATLVPVGDQRWVLVGSRSATLLGTLRDLLGTDGQVNQAVDAGIARVELSGTLPLEAIADLGIAVLTTSPSLSIASALPKISEIANGLRRVVVPSHRSAERWDTESASWRPTDSLVSVGAYRLKDFASVYMVRTEMDVHDGTMGVGNAQVVKHIANQWAGDPLVGYHSRSGSVVVPLGCDLPGLFGRALSLCSGRAPTEMVEHRMLQYPSVSREVANVLYTRVSQ